MGYDASKPVISPINDSATTKNTSDDEPFQVTVSISGMTCSHCTNTIHNTLQGLSSIDPASVQVSLEAGEATMVFKKPITKEELKDTIENLGYDVGEIKFGVVNKAIDIPNKSPVQTVVFSLSGMTCQHCVRTVSDALQNLPGVIPNSVSVSLEKRQGRFSFEGDLVDENKIKQVIEGLGYDLNGSPRFSQGEPSNSLAFSNSFQDQVLIPIDNPNDDGRRKVVMRVIGMTCHSCVSSVTDALENELPNVQPGSVHVNLQTEMAMFICTNPDVDRIHNAIEDRGFSVENIQIIHNLIPPAVLVSNEPERFDRKNSVVSLGTVSVRSNISVPHKAKFQISGMTCSSCVRTIERGLVKLPGVVPDSVQVNLLTRIGTFSVHGDMLDEQTIIKAVKNMGYTASKVVFISGPPNQQPEITDTQQTQTVYKAEMIITGMYCPNCIEKVHSALVKLHGIRSQSIQVDLDSGCAGFEFTGEFITRQRIHQSILQLGFSAESIKVTKSMRKVIDSDTASISSQKSNVFVSTHLVVTGMTCSSCVANIERTMMKQPGVISCHVNLLAKSAVIEHDPNIIGARSLAQMVEQIGYKAELSQDMQGNTIAEQRASMRETMDTELAILKSRFLWSLLFAVPVVLIAMIFMMALPSSNPIHKFFMKPITQGLSIGDLILFLLATPVQFWLGLPFYVKAYKSLVYSHTANMETLVAMGTTVAYVASVASVIAAMVRSMPGAMSMNYFETSVLLITFIHFGKWLEALAKGKTAETITKLMDLQPETATLVEISKNPRQSISERSLTIVNSDTDVIESEDILIEKEIESKDIQGKKIITI